MNPDQSIRRVTILGAGSWGTALATLLAGCDRVTLWARHEEIAFSIRELSANQRYLPGIHLAENIDATSRLGDALKGADCIVFAVPSGGIREVAEAAAPHIPAGAMVVSAAKGLEDSTGFRMSQLIAAAIGSSERVVALSGPNLAVEVARGIPSASVAA